MDHVHQSQRYCYECQEWRNWYWKPVPGGPPSMKSANCNQCHSVLITVRSSGPVRGVQDF